MLHSRFIVCPRDVPRAGAMAVCMAVCMAGCSAPANISPERLRAIGVADGVPYWQAQESLAREGYSCFVTGDKRENFDCTKTVGVFPTCVMRVEFLADDRNMVSALRTRTAACIGTP